MSELDVFRAAGLRTSRLLRAEQLSLVQRHGAGPDACGVLESAPIRVLVQMLLQCNPEEVLQDVLASMIRRRHGAAK